MPILEALTYTHSDGLSAVRLEYKLSQNAQSTKTIVLKMCRRLNDFHSDRIPVYFDYADSFEDLDFGLIPSPIITLLVGPGISVELTGFPQSYIGSLAIPALAIYRVQNPRVIPPVSSPFSVNTFSRPYLIDSTLNAEGVARTDSSSDPFDSRVANLQTLNSYYNSLVLRSITSTTLDWSSITFPELNPYRLVARIQQPRQYLEVFRYPDGVAFKHPYSQQILLVRVPQIMDSNADEKDWDCNARFAYEINTNFDNTGPIVTIVKTGKVTMQLKGLSGSVWIGGRPDPSRVDVFWEIYETDDFHSVPPQGSPIVPRRSWRRALSGTITFMPHWFEEPILFALDLWVGMIPYIGWLVDFGEFNLAMNTNRDRWGRRVDTPEKFLMGLGVFLPLVAGSALRRLDNLLDAYHSRYNSANRIIDGLGELRFNASEKRFISEMKEKISGSRRLSRAERIRTNQLARKLPKCNV